MIVFSVFYTLLAPTMQQRVIALIVNEHRKHFFEISILLKEIHFVDRNSRLLIEIQSLNIWMPVTLRFDHSFASNDMWQQFTLIFRWSVGLLTEIGPC